MSVQYFRVKTWAVLRISKLRVRGCEMNIMMINKICTHLSRKYGQTYAAQDSDQAKPYK